MAEVETQILGRDERARLLDLGAEHLAQRPMQDVGRRVIPPDAVAAFAVDAGGDLVALRDRAGLHGCAVEDETGQAVLRVVDPNAHAIGPCELIGDHTGVADLPAGLGVERRSVEHDVDRCAFGHLCHTFAPCDERADLGTGGLVLLTPGELGGTELVEQLPEELDGRAVAFPSGRRVRFAGTHPLLAHQRVERVEVDGAVAFLRDLPREIDREAQRVVEEERVGPCDIALAQDAVEQVEPAGQGLTEALFFALHHRAHELVVGTRARGTRVPSPRRSRRPARE